MDKYQKLLKKLRFAPHKKIVRCEEKPDLSYLECNVQQLQKKYGVTLKMRHGLLPATRIPGTDLIAESVLILSFAFAEKPWVISKAIICASADKIREKERKVIDLLIEKSNDSAMCDDDDEGMEMLGFFSNHCVVPIQFDDVPTTPDENTYYCMKTSSGFQFENVEINEEYDKLMSTQPDDIFAFRLVKTDILY